MFSADLAQRTVGFERIRATLAAVEPPAERRIALIGSSHGDGAARGADARRLQDRPDLVV